MKIRIQALSLMILPFAMSACGMLGKHSHGAMAKAELVATKGSATVGAVMFHQHGDTVMVHARVTGLKPGQEHGFHIHEKGDCSSGDGMSTGGHFNPSGAKHGASHEEHHAGDLPALKADASGVAEAKFHLKGLSVGEGPANIIGRGLIVHALPDDYKTQPTGNSGARIACAVIAVAVR